MRCLRNCVNCVGPLTCPEAGRWLADHRCTMPLGPKSRHAQQLCLAYAEIRAFLKVFNVKIFANTQAEYGVFRTFNFATDLSFVNLFTSVFFATTSALRSASFRSVI